MQPQAESATPGLRERKKARTRAEIQRAALRLFRERGYEATTVSQIAQAAEVSGSTFFRYFPTKEAVVLWDEFDISVLELYRSQPAGLGPIQALRAALRMVLAYLPPAAKGEVRERVALMLSVPPLRAIMVDKVVGPIRLLAELFADRAGRAPDDFGVRVLAGAVLGVFISAMLAAVEDPRADIAALLDEALAQLEGGFAL
jgi:AcrR family transcriptional regulator